MVRPDILKRVIMKMQAKEIVSEIDCLSKEIQECIMLNPESCGLVKNHFATTRLWSKCKGNFVAGDNMMKVAYVFHGLSGGMNQKGLSTIFDQDGFANIRDKLFDETCDYDTYYHTWEHEQQVEIQQLIKPKKCLYEDPNIFKNGVIGQLNKINSTLNENIHNFSSNVNALYSFYSRFYSMYKSVSLIDNIDEYKLIIISRFDIHFFKKIDLSLFKENTLYVNRFSNEDALRHGNVSATIDGIVGNYDSTVFNFGVHDFFFVGSPDVISKFTDAYLFLNDYFTDDIFLNNKWPRVFSGHSICKHHIDRHHISVSKSAYEESKDFVLRRCMGFNQTDILSKARSLVEQNQRENAIRYLLHYDFDANICVEIGAIYYQSNQINQAIMYFEKSIAIHENLIAYKNLCVAYLNKNDHVQCAYYCKEYLKRYKCPVIKQLLDNLTTSDR